MKRLFSTITLVMLAMLVMAQAPVVSRKKSQDQPTTTPSKPAQQKPATQPTTPRRPTTGVLTITSSPSDASVKLDNDYLGTTPITIRQQRPGTYTITFSAEGYETRSKTVTVTAGETTTCSATLVLKGQAAPVTSVTPTTPTIPTTISTPSTTVSGSCPITDILNPMDGGIYIGWTTVDEAIAAGGNSKPRDDGKHVVSFGRRDYWDHDGDNILESGYFTKYEGIPDSWKGIGLSFDLSYSQWQDWLKRNGFEITIKKAPQISNDGKYSGSLDAEVEATLTLAKLRVDLDFNYSKKSSLNDSGTLYSIRVKRSNIRGTIASGKQSSQPAVAISVPSFAGMTKEEIGKKGRELYDNDNYSEALPYVYEAAKQGYLDSEYLMGLMSYYGDGVVKDYEQAAYWFRKAADSGGIYSMNMLGVCYEYGRGVKQSWTDAVYWYRKSAEDDCGRAQDNLGLCYENGTGVAKDYEQAVYWYQKAADNDISSGQMHLGYCYYNGLGVAKDYDQAVYWYQKAADKGNSAAINNLGVCYAHGYGVAQDLEEAVKWYRKAAEAGSSTGQNNLGDCYYNGNGVAKDYEEAVKWYRKAVAQGNRAAQYNLGWCYYFGQGVLIDKAEAQRLMKLSAGQGYNSAQKFIDEHTF